MAQRDSGYDRIEGDLYESPTWLAQSVLPHIPRGKRIWEPACGGGNIVRVLADAGYNVLATDIVDGDDFHKAKGAHGVDGIVTNPPYTDCAVFIQHALDLMMAAGGFVIMLQSSDFIVAKTRRSLFAECPIFKKVVYLQRRVVWRERDDGKRAQPSSWHAWYIWDWHHSGPATVDWGP